MNMQTGEIRRWDSLTEEQQQSGEWIKLPPHDLDGHHMTRRRSLFDSLLQQDARPAPSPAPDRRGSFDALGRPTW